MTQWLFWKMRTQPLVFHEDVCCFAASRGKTLNEEKKEKKYVCNNTSAICPHCVCVLILYLITSPREGRELSTPHSSRKLSLQSAGSRMSQSNCAPNGVWWEKNLIVVLTFWLEHFSGFCFLLYLSRLHSATAEENPKLLTFHEFHSSQAERVILPDCNTCSNSHPHPVPTSSAMWFHSPSH